VRDGARHRFVAAAFVLDLAPGQGGTRPHRQQSAEHPEPFRPRTPAAGHSRCRPVNTQGVAMEAMSPKPSALTPEQIARAWDYVNLSGRSRAVSRTRPSPPGSTPTAPSRRG
jgi:hypothetical protein